MPYDHALESALADVEARLADTTDEEALIELSGELADLRQGVARHIRLCANTAAINQFLPPLLAQYARRENEKWGLVIRQAKIRTGNP